MIFPQMSNNDADVYACNVRTNFKVLNEHGNGVKTNRYLR